MAIAWVLRDGGITSALTGASRPEPVEDCVGALGSLEFAPEEPTEIDAVAEAPEIDLWPVRPSSRPCPVATVLVARRGA